MRRRGHYIRAAPSRSLGIPSPNINANKKPKNEFPFTDESILKALQLGESITQRHAIERWNCYRLSVRIFDLGHGVYDGVRYDTEEVSEKTRMGRVGAR